MPMCWLWAEAVALGNPPYRADQPSWLSLTHCFFLDLTWLTIPGSLAMAIHPKRHAAVGRTLGSWNANIAIISCHELQRKLRPEKACPNKG
jgi:hypothetical protein